MKASTFHVPCVVVGWITSPQQAIFRRGLCVYVCVLSTVQLTAVSRVGLTN